MPTQTHLFPEPPEPAPPVGPLQDTSDASLRGSSQVGPVWLQRLSLFILVLFCVYVGVATAVLPWLPGVWDHNLFFTSHPALWSVLRLNPVRGVVTGLGLLDIWIGISEAVHYRDYRG